MRSKSVTLSQMVQSACTRLDNGEFQLNNDFSGNFQGNPAIGAYTYTHTHICKEYENLCWLSLCRLRTVSSVVT